MIKYTSNAYFLIVKPYQMELKMFTAIDNFWHFNFKDSEKPQFTSTRKMRVKIYAMCCNVLN